MSHVKVTAQGYRRHSKVRKRILGQTPLPTMVGLGSDELLGSNISCVTMELEISSEDEGDGNDIQQLIASPVSNESINSNNRNVSQKVLQNADDESVWSISIQMFIPFLLAGFGMVAASLLLDVVQVLKIKFLQLPRII